ncbi:MAG: guanylate kinase [Pedosphaera sp.]|nr:guanylate kinase [Pedosphaera sp.]
MLLITAPSGAGKTTVSQGLLANNPDLCRVITCTSRAPRLGEKDGVDYHFLSRAIFLQRIEQGDFLEYADVYGDFKGILKDSVAELLQSGADVLLNVDVQGAATIRTVIAQDPQLVGSLVTLFITPATRGELENRLRGRDADTEESLTRRLETANSEVNCWKEYDYLVLSGSREEDLAQVQAIYFAERSRASRHSFQWTLL